MRNTPSLHRVLNVDLKSKNETNPMRRWMIESALDQGANPNEINPSPGPLKGYTPLSTVFYSKKPDLDIARLLLQRGANPDKGVELVKNGTLVHVSPLYQILSTIHMKENKAGYLNAIRLLLDFKANPNKGETLHGTTPLQESVKNGLVQAVRLLLGYPRTKVDAKNKYNGTALHYCINYQSERLDIARLLLDKGAAPNNKDSSALLQAFMSNNPWRKSPPHLPLIELILRYIPQKNPIVLPTEIRDNTALHRLAREKSQVHDRVARLLLHRGANPNQTDSRGWTPLHTAVEMGWISMIRILLENAADPNKKTTKGLTALHIAVLYKKQDVIKLLLESGANPLIRSLPITRNNTDLTVMNRLTRGKTPLEMNENHTPFMTTWLGERAFRRQLVSKALNSVETKNSTRKRKRKTNATRPKSFMNIPNNVKQRIISKTGLSSTNEYGRKRS